MKLILKNVSSPRLTFFKTHLIKFYFNSELMTDSTYHMYSLASKGVHVVFWCNFLARNFSCYLQFSAFKSNINTFASQTAMI